jgi:uncharacterized membrane protein (DUF485 family)
MDYNRRKFLNIHSYGLHYVFSFIISVLGMLTSIFMKQHYLKGEDGMELEKNSNQVEIAYSEVAKSNEFKQLLKAKRKFILPMSLFFLCFYIALPLMTSYSTVLNKKAIGDITWAWLFAFAQFIMTWVLCIIYNRKAESFDQMTEGILKKLDKGGEDL